MILLKRNLRIWIKHFGRMNHETRITGTGFVSVITQQKRTQQTLVSRTAARLRTGTKIQFQFARRKETMSASSKDQGARLSPTDPTSFSRPDECKCTHIHLKLAVDFNQEILKGSATLEFEKVADNVDRVILDNRGLVIHKVIDDDSGKLLKFDIGEATVFGSKVTINLPVSDSKRVKLCIEYETAPDSTALQWLTPKQTMGKQHPYLFSQCQAIHARSMLPCQDTPGYKVSFSAEISSPRELTALMSGVRQGSEPHPTDPSLVVTRYEQKVPVPTYLIAIVVGALESRDIGPRSKVWCEKEMVDACAYEFSETETMLKTAEDLCGPYEWGVYDVLVLPPSFPYGGMENPCLTFVSPTLVAGDRSLAGVVAHEIAHSWTGNLVTNKNFEHFWLNEGFTVFVERKILGRMFGDKAKHFSFIGGWKALDYAVNVTLEKTPHLSALCPCLTDTDPDDAFSAVPYEKGSNLLLHLEELVGGPEIFEPFLKAYVAKYKFKALDTEEWKEFLYSYFNDKVDVLDNVNWTGWLDTPGMPPVKPRHDRSLADACTALCKRWSSTEDSDLSQFTASDLDGMSAMQTNQFLAELINEAPISEQKVKHMEQVYGLTNTKNFEIKFSWIRLCIRAGYEEIIPVALKFVREQGRMKFVRPVYRDLYGWDKSRDRTIANFQEAREEMHIVCAGLVAKDIGLS